MLTRDTRDPGLTVASMLRRTVERHPDREALVAGGRRFTYAAWNARVNRTARGLAELGVRPHDRVALLVDAGEPAVTLYFACQKLGAVAVPLNVRLASGEVAHALRDSGSRVLAYDGTRARTARRAAALVPGVGALVAVDAAGPLPAGHHPYAALAEHGGAAGEPAADVRPEMLSALVYTSGTTGRAKGVMHTHANDVAGALNCAVEYGLGADDRALHIAPLYHVGGMQAFFVPHVLVGATNLIAARATARDTLEAIATERVTTLFAVPTQLEQLLAEPALATGDVSSLRLVTTGGAALPAAAMQRLLTELCPRLYNGYGMTEASLTLLAHPRDALRRLGSCGKATLISQARVVAHDPGRDVRPDEELAPGEVGQLIVRGPHLTPGYWNDPEQTARRLRHGWLYTGDLFLRDADGHHYFRGRADDLIVTGGENVYPSEVEAVLERCPGVRRAAVVGLPDARWGRAVTAFVVRDDPDLDAVAIDAFCRASDALADFKRPRRVVFVDRLPTNATGKVLRRELAQAA